MATHEEILSLLADVKKRYDDVVKDLSESLHDTDKDMKEAEGELKEADKECMVMSEKYEKLIDELYSELARRDARIQELKRESEKKDEEIALLKEQNQYSAVLENGPAWNTCVEIDTSVLKSHTSSMGGGGMFNPLYSGYPDTILLDDALTSLEQAMKDKLQLLDDKIQSTIREQELEKYIVNLFECLERRGVQFQALRKQLDQLTRGKDDIRP